MLENAGAALDVERIDGVHDTRVATRRLRAALEVFAPCFPKARHKAVLREVKAIADALGERRDPDVAIDALTEFADSIPRPDRPGIHSLIETYRSEQAAANEALGAFIEPARLERLQAAVRELAASAGAVQSEQPPAAAGSDGQPMPEATGA